MDIKDFILIGGGILICLVVAHGFWITYRARREPYRLDIVPDLIPDDVDDMERLRGELPNGGARIVASDRPTAAEATMDMFADLNDPLDLADEPIPEPILAERSPEQAKDAEWEGAREPVQAPARQPRAPITTNEARVSPFSGQTQAVNPTADKPKSTAIADQKDELEETSARETSFRVVTDPPQTRRSAEPQDTAPATASAAKEPTDGEEGAPALAPDVQELLIVNVVALKGSKFGGENLVRALRDQNLRYGEMNIFHRVDPATKLKVFSVANVVEPGVFDLSDLDSLSTPGICFFLQLPGPDDASGAFDNMLNAAQQVALSLGGELRDEQMSVLTGQTKEHMRQRIADFARRKLSRRA